MIGNRRGGGQHGPGFFVINKFGENRTIDTTSTPEVIWTHGAAFPFLDVAIEMDVFSGNVGDAITGTGAQKIQITRYDNSNNEIVEIIELDGTTKVQLSGTTKFVSRMEVTQVGSDESKTNIGDIHAIDRATGSIVYQAIHPGDGQTLSAVQIVPAGKKGLIKEATVNYAKLTNKNDAELTFRIRRANGATVIKHRSVISSAAPKNGFRYEEGGIEMLAGDIAYWQCDDVSANETGIYGTFDIEIEDA